jgi:hypothetical protein
MAFLQIVSILVSIFIFFLVIESIRRGLLKERYALMWLLASIIIMVLSVWRKLLDIVAFAFGFYYPPSFLFLVGLAFLHLIALHFSIVISTLSEKNKRLVQEIGILKEEIKKIKNTGLSKKDTLSDEKKGETD